MTDQATLYRAKMQSAAHRFLDLEKLNREHVLTIIYSRYNCRQKGGGTQKGLEHGTYFHRKP